MRVLSLSHLAARIAFERRAPVAAGCARFGQEIGAIRVRWCKPMNGWKRLVLASMLAGTNITVSFAGPTQVGYSGTDALFTAIAAPSGPDMYKEKSTPAVRIGNDEPTAELRIDHTTFRIPKRYVGYYDTKNHSALALHFLLPGVTPIEPFSVGAVGGNDPRHVADVAILAAKPANYDRYLDRLSAEGKMPTTEYGFGLREAPPSIFLGPSQHGPNPEMRGFLGVLNDQRVFIACIGLGDEGLGSQCKYTFSMPDYALQIDVAASFLPMWKEILLAVINYTVSHKEK